MSPNGDPRDGSDLVDRARSDPASVDPEEIAERASGDIDERTSAANAVAELAASDPDRGADETRPLVGLLDDSEAAVRSAATVAADRLVQTRPDTAAELVPRLVDLLDDEDPSVGHNALTALSNVSPSASASLAPAVPELDPYLESEYASVRDAALSVLLAAVEAPSGRAPPDESALDAATTFVPRLVGLLAARPDDDGAPAARGEAMADDTREALVEGATEVRLRNEEARAKVARALGTLADRRPDAVVDAVPALRSIANGADSELERAAMVDVFARLAATRPDAVRPALDDLAGALRTAETEALGGTAARALSNVAEAHPEAVADAVARASDDVVALLEADDPHAKASGATLVSYLAEVDSAAVSSAVDPLVARLDDEEPTVRGSAALALGALGADRADGALSDLESSDPDPGVRDAASSARSALESGEH